MSKRLANTKNLKSKTKPSEMLLATQKAETVLGAAERVHLELESAYANWKMCLSRSYRDDPQFSRSLFDYVQLHLNEWEGAGIDGWENTKIADFYDETAAVDRFRRFTHDHHLMWGKLTGSQLILAAHIGHISSEDFAQEAIETDWGRQNILYLKHFIDAAEALLDGLSEGYMVLNVVAFATAKEGDRALNELALQTLAVWEFTEREIDDHIRDLKKIVRRADEDIAAAAFTSKRLMKSWIAERKSS